jgi:hypothetical protein
MFRPEMLEGRQLMTGGGGSTFAILPGTISTAGQSVTIPFTINAQNFTRPAGRLVLGVDVVGDASSSTAVQPVVSSVVVTNASSLSPSMAHPRVTHGVYAQGVSRNNTHSGPITSAVLVHFDMPRGSTPNGQTSNPLINTSSPTIDGQLIIKGANNTTGNFLVGFYLPGDTNGDGTVNNTDIQAVRAAMGSKAGSSKYNFDADANRDGKITSSDLQIAMQNEGISTNIVPTVTSNIVPSTVAFYPSRVTTQSTTSFTGSTTPGATVKYTDTSPSMSPVTTTADANGNYSITVPLSLGSNTFQVTTHDSFGQTITGTIAPVTYQLPSSTTITTS